MTAELVQSKKLTQKEHPLTFVTKMVWVAIGMIVVSSIFFKMLVSNYLFVVDSNANPADRCIPDYRYYLVDRKVDAYEVGKIYSFVSKGMSPFFKDNVLITKYLAGVAGDVVVQNEQGVFINGKQIVDSYPLAKKLGVDSASFHKEYVIPEGHYFFTAPAPISFDSRYWGLVSQEQIVGEAKPLW